ncbi:S41 family peptidase [candidate division WOR-3 bacterium]|nr:S41 family peptidase [candidate division WOR-3 bacterium]
MSFSKTLIVLFAVIVLCKNIAAQNFGTNDRPINKDDKAEIIDSVCGLLISTYVYPEVAQKMDSVARYNLLTGSYDHLTGLVDFTEVLNEDLFLVCRDKHFRILPFIDERMKQENGDEEDKKRALEQMRRNNFGFKKIEILPGNIGYLKFDEFVDARYAGNTAVAAMNFLSNCDALIIDLRDNGGGEASMIQLLTSYFFDEQQHINDFYYRIDNVYEQSWTYSFVPGNKIPETPVYILTSSYTFSAAEEFTYNLQKLERASIVGDTTGGGAHPIIMQIWDNLGITIVCPFARACNPVSNDNWEGVGIIPDFPIESQMALEKSQLLALNEILEKNEDPAKETEIIWHIEYIEGIIDPMFLAETELEKYAGLYETREIFIENGELNYLRQGRDPYPMIYIGDDTFLIKDLISLRLKFEKDETNHFCRLIAIYQSGRREINPRSTR